MSKKRFRIEGLEEFDRALKRFPALANEEARGAMRQAAEAVRGEVAVYPPWQKMAAVFASAAQRRNFFADLRAGLIEVPYRRGQSPGSERLGASWTVEVRGAGALVRAVVGTRASYAQMVQGKAGRQAGQFTRRGWVRIDQAMEKARGSIERILQGMMRRIEERIKK